MKRKIAFLIPALYAGGAETQFRYLIEGLNNRGYEITVYTLLEFDPNDDFVKENFNIKFKSLGFDFNKYNDNKIKRTLYLIILYFITMNKFIYHIVSNKFDSIIMYNMILAPFIPIVRIFCKNVIYSERTATKILYKRKYLKPFYKMANYLTCNTPFTKKILNDIGVKKNVLVIQNGININVEPISKIPADDIKNIYIIARIHPVKNQLFAVKALINMPNKKLNLVGKIWDERYFKEIQDFIKKNKLENRVKFIEYTTNVVDIYKKADLIILPSLEEGTSNVILESFLYGKFIVASNIPQNSSLINYKGGLFSLEDPNDLVNCIKTIESLSLDEKKSILKKNREFLEKHFSIERMITEYEKLICEVENK